MGRAVLQTGGAAVHQAAGELVELAKQLAADLLEANAADLVLDTGLGRFHVAGTADPSLSGGAGRRAPPRTTDWAS